MDLSLAPSLNGWSAGRWLPQLEVDTCSFDFASIPDPLRLRHEGVVIRPNEDAPEDAVSDWCDRAHQCLRFLAEHRAGAGIGRRAGGELAVDLPKSRSGGWSKG